MTISIEPPIRRVYAELPTGEHVVPGAHPMCPGADRFGRCSVDDLPSGRPCAGATWHYLGSDQESWHFQFAGEPSLCPVTFLDPLGPVDTPLD
jgi:hypothetical protein